MCKTDQEWGERDEKIFWFNDGDDVRYTHVKLSKGFSR